MNSLIRSADKEWFKKRLMRTAVLVLGVFGVLVLRLFFLQVIEGAEYRRLSVHNCIRLRTVSPSRGLVFDRNGSLIVDNRPSFDLNIVLKDAKPLEETLRKLSAFLGTSPEDLMSVVDRNRGVPPFKPILLAEDMDRDTVAAVEVNRYDLPGVFIDVKPKRHYIHRDSGAHLIGYLGEINPEELDDRRHEGCKPGDLVGKFGVEKAVEPVLRGASGGQQVEVNARGQVVQVLKTVAARPGDNIFLTIDHGMQKKAEELMEGIAGAAVAMDPRTGDVLVMASTPSFDPNGFVIGLSHRDWRALTANPFRPMENKAIQGEYPPASTYKIVTAMAGLEEGVIDENTTFFCPGYHRLGNRIFRCWKRGGHGTVDVLEALSRSCDVFFYQVGQKLGVDRIAKYARACGLGSPVGLPLDREAGGLIPTAAWKKQRTGIPWMGGETLPIAIGQGYNLTTPIQLLTLIGAVANNGSIVRPSIIGRIETADGLERTEGGEAIADVDPPALPASPETLRLIRKGLWRVVNGAGGTARVARLSGVEVCGKTGTAQVVGRRKGDGEAKRLVPAHFRAHAWFVAYAPAETPEIAVAVIIENGEHGSGAAAPIAREIIRFHQRSKGI